MRHCNKRICLFSYRCSHSQTNTVRREPLPGRRIGMSDALTLTVEGTHSACSPFAAATLFEKGRQLKTTTT
jgi:hypothetical protein